MAAEAPTGLQLGTQGEPDQVEAPAQAANALASESDSKVKKAPTGARARSIKTPLQREALEAAYLINQFPAEEVRRALGDRIQLTENQVQVWFSHKRRKDKKTQQSTGQAASTPPTTSAPSSTVSASSPAAPAANIPEAAPAPALTSADGPAASANTAAPPVTAAALAAAPAAAPAAASIAPAAGTVQPGHSIHIQQGSIQLPASLQLPYSHLNGNPVFPSRLSPADAQQTSYRAPTVEQVVRSQPLPAAQPQPMFRPEPHSAPQPESLSQTARVVSTQVPRQFLPHQYPPQSFLAAQQSARLGTGVSMSAFQATLPVQASPAIPAMTPMSIQTPTAAALAAAAASSAPAMSAAWSAARSSPHIPDHLPASMTGAGQTPDIGYFHGSRVEAMHEDSDAGTEDMDTAPLSRGSHAEWRDLVEHAKLTLPVAYRSDGPQLAFVFDEPPSPDGADGNDPDGPAKRKRVMVDGYEMEDDGEDGMNFKKARLNPNQIRRPPSAGKGGGGKEDAERRAYREAEKAQMLAKRVEQTMAKDKERMEREKKRVKEKLEREKKKDEVAQEKAAEKLRQFQIREAKKAAERAEKEKKAEERKRLQDEKRREKELLRALAAQERQATRLRQRDVNTGPKDDLDIEWEQLMEAHHQAGYGSGTEDQPDQRGSNLPERPEFPPPSLNLVPAFATDLPHKQGSDMLTVCAFLHSFTDLLGLPPVTLDNLLSAVVSGEQSRLLADVHIALLRLLQMDLEDAHATGAIQGGGATNFMDRAIVNCAHALEEAWAWGFDVDVWRAHLNTQTWPEVLRQYSIAMGLGQKRPKPRRGTKPKLGTEGEDVVKDDAGRVTLVAPARFGLGTVKGAAYKVLQDVGPEGLSITEIARRIQEQGLRDLTTSKTPEASVAGALSRDVIFARVAPATYSLQAIISRHKSGNDANTVKAEVKAEDDKAADVKTEVKAEPLGEGQEAAVKSEPHDQDTRDGSSSESSSDEDEDDEGKVNPGESWLQHLKTQDYDELSFEQRVNILWTLVNLALDGPTVRAALEGRTEEAQRIRKQMWEEAKVEKRRRQQEAAEKAKKSAEEAQRALEAYNANPDSPNHAASTPVHTEETNGSLADAQQSQAERNAGASTSQSAAAPPHDPDDEMSSAVAIKLRSQQRADTIRHAEEVNAIRGEPLGLDRRHNRYWHFAAPQEAGAAADPSLGRILIESHENGTWRLLGQAHQIEHLMSSLERKGAREGVLHNALVRYQSAIQQGMPAYSIHMPPTLEEQSQQERSRLYMEHHSSLWNLSIQALTYLQNSDPVSGLPTHKGEASTLTKLRADMLRVEAALPLSAMKDANWNSDAWQAQVKGAYSTLQLRQALGELEMAVHEGFLWQGHPQPRQPLLVKGAWMPIGQAGAAVEVQQPTEQPVSDPSVTPAMPASASDSLAWLPATSAAISLRLFAIDAAIIYRPGDLPGRELIQGYAYVPRSAATPHVGMKSAEHTEARTSMYAQSAGPSSHAPRSKSSSLFPPFPQALLQGPRKAFRLPVADFKQAVLDAQNGVAAPSSRGTSLKVRLPISRASLAGQLGKPRSRPPASRTKPPGHSRNSLGNGRGRSHTASKASSVHWQAPAEDMDLDIVTARSNTATPGPSEDDIQSPSRSVAGSDDEEPEISSEEEQQNNSDVELSD